MLKELLARITERKNRFKEIQHEVRTQKRVEDTELSANERELNRFLEEERQSRIKRNLEQFRKNRHNEIWHGRTVLQQKNIFTGHGNEILRGKSNILNNGRYLFR